MQVVGTIWAHEQNKMPRSCSVCSHRDRPAIEAALLAARESLRAIGRRFAVGKDAIDRHQRVHMAPPADPLNGKLPACHRHGNVPHWFLDGDQRWLCSSCHRWNGKLAYFRMPEPPYGGITRPLG
jgi:hypothetical protein